jgi:hypothetical protein
MSVTSGLETRRTWVESARAIDNAAYSLGYVRPYLLVTGFWRSGTTWLQQCLAEAFVAKTTFEPLSPLVSYQPDFLEPFTLATADHRQAFIPYLDGSDRRYEAFWSHLEPVVNGYCHGPYGLLCRRRLTESFRRRLIIKCVRLQFSHKAMYDTFRLPIVHIRRHPCAVVASVRDLPWPWHFRNVDLFELLYRIGDGREDYLRDARQAVRKSNTTLTTRIAAYWAISEAYVQRSLKSIPASVIIRYESVIDNPIKIVDTLSQRLELGPATSFDSSVVSPTSVRATNGNAYRLASWRDRLNAAEIKRIYLTVQELFPDWQESE